MQTIKRLGDFIPNGKELTAQELVGLNFREIKEDEIFQCCAADGCDSEGRYIYCGSIAEIVTIIQEREGELSYVALCRCHRFNFKIKIVKAQLI